MKKEIITKEEQQQMEETIKVMKEKILNMSKEEIEAETKYIIEFKDFGQDFLEWFIDKDGYVLDSKPFQREVWAGKWTIPQLARAKGKLAIWSNGESYVNYPIKSVKIIGDLK